MKSLYESILDDEESILDQGDQTAIAMQWKEKLEKSGLLEIGNFREIPTIIPISKDKFALKYQEKNSGFHWILHNKEHVDLLRNHCEYIEIPGAIEVDIDTNIDVDFKNLIKFRHNGVPIDFGSIHVAVRDQVTLSNIDSDEIPLVKKGSFIISGRIDKPTVSLKNVHWVGEYFFIMENINIQETENVELVRVTTHPYKQFRFNNIKWPKKVADSIVHYLLGYHMEYWNFQYSNGTVTLEDANGEVIEKNVEWSDYRVKKIYAKKQHTVKWIFQKYMNLFESDKVQNLYVNAGPAKTFNFDTYKRKPLVKRYVLWSPRPKDLKFKAWCDTSEDKDINWTQYESGCKNKIPAVSTVAISTCEARTALTQCESNCSLLEINCKDLASLFLDKSKELVTKDKISQKLFEEYINFDNFPNLKYIVLNGMSYSLKRIDKQYWGKFK